MVINYQSVAPLGRHAA